VSTFHSIFTAAQELYS